MKLLPENKLIWSPIVANSRMNRERNLSGINSYEQEFKFKPEAFLEERIRENGNARWLDLCCGYGKAVVQAGEYFYNKQLQDKVSLKGVDLIGDFLIPDPSLACVQFESKSVMELAESEKYDLITCVHGLHYLGDKLKVIERIVSSLHSSGLFIANLDLDNIVVKDVNSKSFLKTVLKEKGLDYNSRTRLIKKVGGADISFNMEYLGADDDHGPNYTGQESVTSYYKSDS